MSRLTQLAIHRPTLATLLVCGVVLLLFVTGCSRSSYRHWADRDAYRLIDSRQSNPQWKIPNRTVEPDSRSRLADANDPDCEPLPPDDPAAACYMRKPHNSRRPVRYWDQRGQQNAIDDGSWESALPYDQSGAVKLDKQLAVDLALTHNREFQTRVEQLYVSALVLSQNRFEFDLNWFGGSDGSFFASGDGADAVRNLNESNNLGFTKNFASGGQFATELVNSLTWQLGGNGNSNFAAGNLLFSLTQPLLRGAFRHVRTESLTQAERDLLYEVRDFARFRREFYFDIVSQYLDLLNQTQAVRNEEDNLLNLELQLEEHTVLLERDLVSTVRVDQVFQNFQSGRLALINSQQSLQTSLDQFKFLLGLPARIKITFDESLLEPFQLNSANLVALETEADRLKDSLLEFVPPDMPPKTFVNATYEKIKQLGADLKKLKPQVDQEFENWVQSLKEESGRAVDDAARADNEQQRSLQKRVAVLLKELDDDIADADKIYEEPLADLEIPADEEDSTAVKSWKRLEALIVKRSGLKERIGTLTILQTQIRLFSIELTPLDLEEQTAVEIALQRRLDLMNNKGFVTDAYRAVEIAADQLESDLSVNASASVGTDNDNAFRFDSNANQYNLGFNFDGPLNRFGERNGYRVAQIAFQQQRRQYMATEDAIVNGVRLNLRQLRTNRFTFQIARQQLIAVTRQVEQAQFNLRTATSNDSSPTQDLLQALELLRNTKNGLISSWIQYETSRIAVFVDLESLQLDEQGVWVNDQDDFGVVPMPVLESDGESEYEPSTQRSREEERFEKERSDEGRSGEEPTGEDRDVKRILDGETIDAELLDDGIRNEGPVDDGPVPSDVIDDQGRQTSAGFGSVVADRRGGGLQDLR